jgi:hypothetical protein
LPATIRLNSIEARHFDGFCIDQAAEVRRRDGSFLSNAERLTIRT